MTDTDRLRSISQTKTKGMARVKELREDGKVRGFEVEYRDGRQEAVVRPATVAYKISLKDET